MKSIIKFTALLIITGLIACSNTKKNQGLKALVINNFLTSPSTVDPKLDKNKSMVQMEKADLAGSYTGKCFESFHLNGAEISPTTYYNSFFGGAGGALNNNVKKSALSTSSCTTLGFTTGTGFGAATQRPNPDTEFSYKLYLCDPNNNSCSKTAITAAGF